MVLRERAAAKYSRKQILEAKRLLADGMERSKVAVELQINLNTIHAIASNRQWQHL
jgi:hypothetical protein